MNFAFKKTYQIPSNIKITHKNNKFYFEGPLGKNVLDLSQIDVGGYSAFHLTDQHLSIAIRKEFKKAKSFFNTLCKLIEIKIQGVSRGFLVYLSILGVGYKAQLIDSKTLSLKLGYSHEVIVPLPNEIRVFLTTPTEICLYSVDKQIITEFAVQLKRLKPVEAFKGKGIRLKDEVVILKKGKKK